MSESAARAERLEFRSSNSPTYLWRVAAKPIAVRLSLEVVSHMAQEILDNFRSVSARGSEVGGLLLGSVTPGEPIEVTVQGYQSIPCDYSRGPLYRLAEADKQHFDDAIGSYPEHGGLSVVGFFRSNTRKGLSLDAEDLTFLASRFADPAQIALLIRPFATKTSVAGIFLWENGTVSGEASPMEFPFSAADLERLQAVNTGGPSQSKPQARAQVVPIASRRETTNVPEATIELEIPVQAVPPPTPEPTPIPEPEPAPAPVEVHEEPAPIEAAAPVVDVPPPAAQPIATPLATPSFGMPAAKAAGRDGDRDSTEAESGGKLKWIGAGIASVLVLLALFVYPGFLRNNVPAPVTKVSPALALRAERTAGDLLVMWNRDAESVRTAVKAVLTISDGPQQENLVMDLAQLRNGSVVYTPATPDVSFRLEVTSSDPAKSQSELLRVLKTAGSAASTATKAAEPAAAAKTPAPVPAAPVATEDPAPRAPRTASKPFNAGALESPAARLRAARPSDLLEPPPASGGTAPSSMSFPGAPASPVAAPSAPPPPPVRVETTQAPVRVGGDVQAAQLTVRREPVYPPLARQSRVEGAVMMEAKIGADGRVKEVKTLQGHPMLRNAAMDAVKQWTYRPAMLNGQAVESTSRVEVHFVSGR